MELEIRESELVLRGDFDVRSTFAVRGAIYDQVQQHQCVVVDMTEVWTTDLTALRVLAVATRMAERQGKVLLLRGCGPAVRRLLRISRLHRLVRAAGQRQPITA